MWFWQAKVWGRKGDCGARVAPAWSRTATANFGMLGPTVAGQKRPSPVAANPGLFEPFFGADGIQL